MIFRHTIQNGMRFIVDASFQPKLKAIDFIQLRQPNPDYKEEAKEVPEFLYAVQMDYVYWEQHKVKTKTGIKTMDKIESIFNRDEVNAILSYLNANCANPFTLKEEQPSDKPDILGEPEKE